MRIPITNLSSKALLAVIQEFVTRDGTDHSPTDDRIQEVLVLLEEGTAELNFDSQTNTCNVVINGDRPTN